MQNISEEESMPIDIFPRRTRMKQPSWHKPNPVHADLAKRAEKDREIKGHL